MSAKGSGDTVSSSCNDVVSWHLIAPGSRRQRAGGSTTGAPAAKPISGSWCQGSSTRKNGFARYDIQRSKAIFPTVVLLQSCMLMLDGTAIPRLRNSDPAAPKLCGAGGPVRGSPFKDR